MKEYTIPPLSIKAWAEEDRPREKMLLKGKAALSDAELIALLIGSASVGDNAIALSQRILDAFNGNLSELGRRTPKELMKFKGIGEAKAISIAAALELGRRRQFSDMVQPDTITDSRDVFNYMSPILIDLRHEEFWILLLNQRNDIIGRHRISSGGVSATLVDSKMVFKPVLEALATAIILIHNHPSGNLKPSAQDIDLTRKLKEAGQYLDIRVVDHLIIAHSGYYSFGDEGMM
jgi:DNA repair protein RadC